MPAACSATRPATSSATGASHEQPRAGDAGLALVEEDPAERAARGRIQVGVGEHDVRALAAELERDALQPVDGGPDDLLAGGGLTGERDLAHARMPHQRRADVGAADHDVHDAGREPGLVHQLHQAKRRERRQLRRLDHDRASRRERRSELVADLEQREVPRGDRRDHAHRLALGDREHPGDRVRQDLALDLRRPSRVVAQQLDRQRDVDGLRLPHRLAVVEHLDRRELVLVLLEQVGEVPHQPSALRGRREPPRVERPRRRRHRRVDLPLGRERRLGQGLPGRRVHRGEGALGLHERAVDVEAERSVQEAERRVRDRRCHGFLLREDGVRRAPAPGGRARCACGARRARRRCPPSDTGRRSGPSSRPRRPGSSRPAGPGASPPPSRPATSRAG